MVCPQCGKEANVSWRFCAYCGSRQGVIRINRRVHELTGPGPYSISFQQEGAAPVPFVVRADESIRVSPIEGEAVRLQTLMVEWVDREVKNAEIELLVADAKRQSVWQRDEHRREVLQLDLVERSFAVRAMPMAAVFTANRKSRRLTLINEGAGTWRITRIEKPHRVRLDYDPAAVIGRNHELELEIVTEQGATSGDLTIHLEPADDASASAHALVVPVYVIPGSNQAVPDVHVGVDFGTSNTSVAYREHGTDRALVLPLFNQGTRIPTEVYCPSEDAPPRDWLFGRAAFEAFEDSNYTGIFARDLKSALRHDPDRQLPGSPPPDITYRSVLVEFLRRLLRAVIVPFVSHSSPDALEGRIEFVFSVPVLDDDEAQEAYRETMLAAARAAGYEEYGRLITCLEPTGAASYLVREMKVPVQPGKKLVVFDSGGGTTDICLGTVEQRNGVLELVDIRTEAATYLGRQFGGTVVSWAIGKLWSNDKDPTKNFLPALRELAATNMRAANGPDPETESPATFLEHDTPSDQDVDPTKWGWPKKYLGLWRMVDGAKIEACESGTGLVGGIKNLERAGIANPLTVTNKLLNGISNSFAKGCESLLRDIMAEADVCFVGGNSRLSGLTERVGDFAARDHPVPADDRDLAVAKGTVWVSEWMRGGLPYTLFVTFQERQPKELRIGTQPVLGHAERVGSRYDADSDQSFTVGAKLVLPDGTESPILLERVQCPGICSRETVQMTVRFEQSLLVFRIESHSQELGHGPVHWERRYEI